MRIALIAPGSRGDVQPFLALGAVLSAAGHEVRIATHSPFRELVEAHGGRFAPLHGDPHAMMLDPSLRDVGTSAGNPVRHVRALTRALRALGERVVEDSWHAARGADAVVHCGPLSLPGYYAAEELGLPSAAAAVQPLSRTRGFPVASAPDPGLPGGLNLLTHVLAEQAFWRMFRGPVDEWRRGRGLSAAPRRGPFARWQAQGHPRVYGFSTTVLPKPADWGAADHVTGAWLLDSPPGARLSPKLDDFLAAGPPPVYVGFGSVPIRDPERLTETVLGAVRRGGLRAVLGAGWGGLGAGAASDQVLSVGETEHDLLFPRMRAVIHHGGAGTTHAAMRAGVPTLAVPFGADQGLWGRRIAALGAGPSPITYRRLTIDRLTGALRALTEDGSMAARAEAVGGVLRRERGLERAVEVLARELAGPSSRPGRR